MTTQTLSVPVSTPLEATARGGFVDVAAGFNRRGLFVGGCPKSGTTLLLTLLDGHPELTVMPEETHYFDQAKKYRALSDYSAKLRHLLNHSELRLLNQEKFGATSNGCRMDDTDANRFDYSRFIALASSFIERTGMNDSLLLSETIRAFVITMGYEWRDCVRWVEKTPSNVPHMDDMFRMFPEAKLIQVVRDPRAVFASRSRRQCKQNGSYAKAHRLVREWNESSRQIRKLREHPDNCLVIRYEDLLQNSRQVLEEVCQFIGIQFTPVLLAPTKAGRLWQGNSAYFDGFTGIDSQPLDRWKSELTENEIWWIELHCREGMEIAGYHLQTDAAYSLKRWAKRLPGESTRGYLRARKSSLCQFAGLLKDCRYD